jgi:hypothetical protein
MMDSKTSWRKVCADPLHGTGEAGLDGVGQAEEAQCGEDVGAPHRSHAPGDCYRERGIESGYPCAAVVLVVNGGWASGSTARFARPDAGADVRLLVSCGHAYRVMIFHSCERFLVSWYQPVLGLGICWEKLPLT